MSEYSELIKNFEKIRAYIREFYVYGFKSRDEYKGKSSRSYDDEKRRIESWLGEYMSFVRTPEGKSVFLSIDSRTVQANPLYKAWKSKSFTDGEITLHFILFDILYNEEIKLSVTEIMERIDRDYMSFFDTPLVLDESTVRKKLKEYCNEGILVSEKQGKRLVYARAADLDIRGLNTAISYFSEVLPCGAIGSFLLDKADMGEGGEGSPFTFKHHYITGAVDSGVLATLFEAMRKKSAITAVNNSRKSNEPKSLRLIPLRIFISVQNGRQHLLAYEPGINRMSSLRVDYLSSVKIQEPTPRFDELRASLDKAQDKMWGVALRRNTERVELTVRVGKGEEHIVRRLEREKRNGTVEKIDDTTYRFVAEVYDSNELVPWIRTFICRITDLKISNPAVEKRFKDDIKTMYAMYGIEEVGE